MPFSIVPMNLKCSMVSTMPKITADICSGESGHFEYDENLENILTLNATAAKDFCVKTAHLPMQGISSTTATIKTFLKCLLKSVLKSSHNKRKPSSYICPLEPQPTMMKMILVTSIK